jgi:hypothetical protein
MASLSDEIVITTVWVDMSARRSVLCYLIRNRVDTDIVPFHSSRVLLQSTQLLVKECPLRSSYCATSLRSSASEFAQVPPTRQVRFENEHLEAPVLYSQAVVPLLKPPLQLGMHFLCDLDPIQTTPTSCLDRPGFSATLLNIDGEIASGLSLSRRRARRPLSGDHLVLLLALSMN